jgi:hypothetical protein
MVDETIDELAESKAWEEEALLIIQTNQTSSSVEPSYIANEFLIP